LLPTTQQQNNTKENKKMAPFTVSTRGVVLGGKAGSGIHDSIDLGGREDVKGALRVDASTNVKDTDLVFTTTDHTVRTVRDDDVPPSFFFAGGGGAAPAPRVSSPSPSSCRAPPGRRHSPPDAPTCDRSAAVPGPTLCIAACGKGARGERMAHATPLSPSSLSREGGSQKFPARPGHPSRPLSGGARAAAA